MPILHANPVDYGYGTNIHRARKLGVALRQAGGGLGAAARTKSQKSLAGSLKARSGGLKCRPGGLKVRLGGLKFRLGGLKAKLKEERTGRKSCL